MDPIVKEDKRTGNWLSDDELAEVKADLKRFGVRQIDVAERYGCSPTFIYAVLAGRTAWPDQLLTLVRRIIAGHKSAEARKANPKD